MNASSCEAGSPPAPTSGRRRAFSHATSGLSAGSASVELRRRLLGRVRLENPALGFDDLPERPEGDAVSVGKAAALTPADEPGAVLDLGEQLRAEAALSHPRFAHDRHQLAGALLDGALERADEECLLELSADERRRERADDVSAEAGTGLQRTVEAKRLGLALDRDRLELLEVEDALGRAVRRLRAADAVDRRHSLEAGGGVDDVSRDESLAFRAAGADGDDRLTRVDPDAHLERERRILRVQLDDRLQDAESGPHGALRVVLVGDGRAEDGHDRVADELLHRPSVALDLLTEAREVRADAGADVLGVGLLRGGGEADEVAE